MIRNKKWAASLLALTVLATQVVADPEIMVHEADLAAEGQVVSTLHANRVLSGNKHSDDGTWPVHGLTNLMAEFATGVAPGWEVGIHLPMMRAGVDAPGVHRGEVGSAAVMFRVKHIRHAEDGWFYGFNAEYDINAARFVAEPRSVEFRGIAGYDGSHFRLVANPHLMWGFGRSGIDRRPDFNVDLKALYKYSKTFAFGSELYMDWGKLNELAPGRGDRTLYLVTEAETALGAVHVGVGRGFRDTPEKYVAKLVWALNF